MSGFQHDIAGGQGNLIIPALQSPNFQLSPLTGWQVDKNGNAYFESVTVGSGVQRTYVQATAPAAPNLDDLWIDTASSNALFQWNGSSWTAYQWGTGSIANGAVTASLIAANTITAAQLAAGIVYAGIVNSTTVNAATFTGSTFEGTDFIINTAGAFFYSGTPATGNLIASIARTSGTDGFSNAYQAGFVTYASGGVWSLLSAGLLQFQGGTGQYAAAQLYSPTDGSLQFSSGQQTSSDAPAGMTLQSGVVSGILNGALNIGAGNVLINQAGGPFISGETFHTITNATNFTGTMRVKLLPWNAVWIDVEVIYSGTAAVTASFGSLPSASYYPTASRQFPLSCTQPPTAITAAAGNRLFVPVTSGAVQIVIPQALTTTNAQLSLSVMYPTN